MLLLWCFLILVASFGLTKAHLDLTPPKEPEPSFSYCIGGGCTSEGPFNDDPQAVNDEGFNDDPGFQCPSNETSFHADVTDCHRYYICYQGISSLQTCQNEMGYLPSAELCVAERFVQACNVVICEKNGIMADKIDCERYYNCFFGHPYHLRCAKGTRFDPISRQCSSTVPCLTGSSHNHTKSIERK